MVCSISCRNQKVRLFALALACFTVTGICVAQEPTPTAQGPAIKVQVQQVLVPVVVTDRKGHFITDLKTSDFQVFEDGVEQKLASFTTHEDATPDLIQTDTGKEPAPRPDESQPAPPPNTITDSRPRHTYLIVIDTLNSSLGSFVYVREALKKLFKQEQGADTQYAVIELGRTTFVIQNLTRNPKAVLAALENKQINKPIVSNETSNFARQEIELRQMLEEVPRPPIDTILDWANQTARERDRLMRNFIIDLHSLTQQLSQMPGRRVLIVASDGFNLEPGRELFDMIATFTETPKYAMYNKSSYLSEEMKSIARLATAQNVTFYTLDSRGLSSPPGPDISENTRNVGTQMLAQMTSTIDTSTIEKQDPMNFLAQATGGIFYHNSNDLLKGLHQAIADGRSYYELAYYSSNPAMEGKYRAIKVEVKGKSFVVRAKPGYWASAMNNPTIAATAGARPSTSLDSPPPGNIPMSVPPAHAKPFLLQTAPGTSLVDIPTAELIRMVPELKDLQPAANQDLLASILQKVGSNVATLFTNFPNVTSREQVVEQRRPVVGADLNQVFQDEVNHDYRYLALPNPGQKQAHLKEYRTDAKGRMVTPNGLDNGYMITEGFVSTPVFFDPAYQADSKFRYLGQEVIDKQTTYVVAFAQLPRARVKDQIGIGNGKSLFVLTQGLAWIDPVNLQIVRMWTGLLAPVPEINLQAQTTRVNFAAVRFQGMAAGLWLPRRVEVEMKFPQVIFRDYHTYSEFKLFTVQTQQRQDAPASP